MSRSRSTSNTGTLNATGGVDRSNRSRDPIGSLADDLFGSAQGAHGRAPTPPCTEDLTPDIGTKNDFGDCAIDLLFSGDSHHPIAIVCETHGWRGSVS
jgi:hypothetical protein